MNLERGLKTWLKRTGEEMFLTQTKFGIKVWNSMEVILLTKYEIITQEFCNSLLKKTFKLDDENLSLIDEFLSLQCAPGAISSAVKKQLVYAIVPQVESYSEGCPVRLLIVLLDKSGMQSFYKTDHVTFLRVISGISTMLGCQLSIDYKGFIKEEHDHSISLKKTLDYLKTYTKQTPHMHEWRPQFAEVLPSLIELDIRLREYKVNVHSDVIEIIKCVYFDEKALELLKKNKQALSETLTGVDSHVFLTILDALVAVSQHDTEMISILIQVLFGYKFPKLDQNNYLVSFTLLMDSLLKHQIQMTFEIKDETILQYFGNKIVEIVEEANEINLYDILQLLCATMRLNPMILEKRIFQILTKCMFVAKQCDKVLAKYEEFATSVLEMFKRLSRGEKFVTNLMKSLQEQLSSIELSSKSKRKLQKQNETSKKSKLNDESILLNKSTHIEVASQNKFVLILLSEMEKGATKSPESSELGIESKFKTIEYALPVHFSCQFSKFVASLVSKPSLVIWKSLLFAFKDVLAILQSGDQSENALFQLDFVACLLCDYYAGSRLADQSEKLWDDIAEIKILAAQLTTDFAQCLFKTEHNTRTMNAFLQICLSSGDFNLMLLYYAPDSVQAQIGGIQELSKAAESIHSYLGREEWHLIEQRIVNFGENVCKTNMNRLLLQRIKATLLFSDKIVPETRLLSPTFTDPQLILAIIRDPICCHDFTQMLDTSQLIEVNELLLTELDFKDGNHFNVFQNTLDCKAFVEILSFSICKKIIDSMESKVLKKLKLKDICELKEQAFAGFSGKWDEIPENKITIQNDSILNELEFLKLLPVGYLEKSVKNCIFVLNLITLAELKRISNNETLIKKSLNIFDALLNFGATIEPFKFISMQQLLLKFKDVANCEQILNKILAASVKSWTLGDRIAFEQLSQMVGTELSNEALQICLIPVEHLAKAKKCKDVFETMRIRFLEKFRKFFKSEERNAEVDREYVEKMVDGFMKISQATLASGGEVDEEFRRIYKIFIGHSINWQNLSSVQLVANAIQYKDALLVSDTEIQLIVQKYSDNFISAKASELKECNSENIVAVLRLTLSNSTDKDFVKLMTTIQETYVDGKNSLDEDKLRMCSIFSFMAQCNFTKEKGSIFCEFFANISYKILLSIKMDANLLSGPAVVLQLLESSKSIVANKQIPMSLRLIDDLLTFLIHINVKNLDTTGVNLLDLIRLFSNMSDLLLKLIQNWFSFVSDRIPQVLEIFKSLLQTVCLYKGRSNQKNVSLEAAEISVLADMAHKLEVVMKFLASHSRDMKRVAPYMLSFIISLMISDQKPTTVYPKIRTHVQNICYELIGICDHRVEGFILRGCNEAGKNIYTNLSKQYVKYRKFSGKV